MKATPQDEEAEAETEKQFAQLSIALSELQKELSLVEAAKRHDVGGQSMLSSPQNHATSDRPPPCAAATLISSDEDPIFNPFTSSFASRETGFEPGPSVQYEGLSKQQEDSTPPDSNGYDTAHGDKHTEHALHDATVGNASGQPGVGDAERTWYPEQTTDQDSRSEIKDTDRSGQCRLGYMAGLVESWVPPMLRGFAFQGSLFSKSKQSTESEGRQQPSTILSNEPPINRSNSETASLTVDRSQDDLVSLSTAPSSSSVVRLERISSATDKAQPTYSRSFSSPDAGISNEDLTYEQKLEKQMQAEKEEAARVVKQDRMEAIRLQELLDQEDARERQATLDYVKGLDEAIRLQEEERELQAQQQAAIDFAQDLKQANLENAAQLEYERMIQCDHDFAKELQKALDNGTTFEFPESITLSKPQLHSPSNPFMSGALPNTHDCGTMQNLREPVTRDRGFAQKVFDADRARAAKVRQEHESLVAELKASEALNVQNSPMDETVFMATNMERARQAEEGEFMRIQTWKAYGSNSGQASPQMYATQAAQVATTNDVADCGICGDSFPKTRLVKPCEHFYCRKCLLDR